MAARATKRITLVRRDTALVMDGFLRSGNTFSVAAFVIANGSDHHLGRHLHGAPHILRAARMGVPTVVLIRKPDDAVSSYLIRRPSLTPGDALREYLDFYRTSWKVRDHFVVGLFDDVVTDFGRVIDAVNAKFGTHFLAYEPTPANEAAAFALVEEMNRLECRGEIVETHVGRPSPQRDERKREIQTMLQQPRTAALLSDAMTCYEKYVDLARSSTRRTQQGGNA
jgi:hypothetical protein